MSLLTRITTEFSETEDRIRLSSLDEAGDIVTLWLTRRLADRLFASLIAWLDDRTDGKAGGALLHSFEQQAAMSGLAPSVPVPAPGAPSRMDGAYSHGRLIDNVDVTKGDNGVVLALKDAAGREAKLALTTTELRQWLSICHRCYQKAEWPLTIWPGWMASNDAVVPADRPHIMH